MNSECKNYPMKEFRAIFPISSDFGHQVRVCKKRSHLNISCNSKKYGIYINLGCRFEFRTQNLLPYERISGNFFRFHRFWSIRSGYAKKDHFSILAVLFKKIWDLHKFGLQIWIQNAKITLWKNFGQFFSISSILVNRSGYAKKDHISILAVIQKIWDLHKFGLQIWIQNAKITLWKNFGQFFSISSILVIRSGYATQKITSLWILAVIQKIWDLYKSGLQIRFQNHKNYPMERISGRFFDFIDFGHQVRVCKKRSHLNISCNSKNMGFT